MAKPKTAPAKNFSEEIVEIFGGMVRSPARMLFQKSELPSVEYDVGVAGCDCEHQKQKADGRKNQSGDGEATACVKSRPLADLYQRDDRKNETKNVERKSAATTKAGQRQNAENQSRRRKGIGSGQLPRR